MSASATASPSSSFGDVNLRPVRQTPRFVQYEGTGTKVFTIEKPAAGTVLVKTTIDGPVAQDTVYTLAYGLVRTDLIASADGPYQGTSFMSGAGATQRVEVAVVGHWSLAVSLLEDAPPLLSHNSGTGDDVFLYLDAPHKAAISWGGEGALITVAGFSKEKGTEVLVNDNKPGHRTFQLHTGEYIQVSGVAHWTINVLG